MLVLHGIQLRNNTLNKQCENKTLKMYQKENKKKSAKICKSRFTTELKTSPNESRYIVY